MGNKNTSIYQNHLKINNTSIDSNLLKIDSLFYQEYLHKDQFINQEDQIQIDTILCQLVNSKFIDCLKLESKNEQDYDRFLLFNGSLIEDKLLVFSVMKLIHEVMSILVLNQTQVKLEMFNKNEEKEIKKNIKEMKKELKKIENKVIKEEKKTRNEEKQINHQLLMSFKFKQTDESNEDILQLNYIKNHIITKFMPVFSKYNFNVINKTEYQTKYQDYLESKYRDILICFGKVFNGIQLFNMKQILKEEDKFWNYYQRMDGKQSAEFQNGLSFQKCIVNLVDQQINELIIQGNIMKMCVRYKIMGEKEEDIDMSIDVGIDSIQIPQNRVIQQLQVSFSKKKTHNNQSNILALISEQRQLSIQRSETSHCANSQHILTQLR